MNLSEISIRSFLLKYKILKFELHNSIGIEFNGFLYSVKIDKLFKFPKYVGTEINLLLSSIF